MGAFIEKGISRFGRVATIICFWISFFLLISSAVALAEEDIYGITNKGALEDAVLKAVDKLVNDEELELGMPVVIVGIERKGIREKKVKDILSTAIVNAKSPEPVNASRFIVITPEEDVQRSIDRLKWEGGIFVDPPKAQQLGRMSAAKGLIFGDISKEGCIETLHLFLDGVETGQRLWEDIFTGYPNKSRLSATMCSIIPGGGQFYNCKPRKGFLFGLPLVGALIGGGISHKVYSDKYDEYLNATNIDDIEKYYDESRWPYRIRNILFPAAIALSMVSMYDAYRDADEYHSNRFSGRINNQRKVNFEIQNAQMLFAYRHNF